MIDENNKNIGKEIERHEQLSKMSETEKTAARLNLANQILEMKNKNAQKEAQISFIEGQMGTIKNHVWNMVDKFGASHFTLAVASHMHYDEEVVFNENNVTLYLSELEEYISNFITYLASKDKQPDAPIAGLSLENMINKDFEKGVMSIEAPNPHDPWTQPGDETNTEAEEIVINPRDLYRKFDELASKGMVIPQGTTTVTTNNRR
jgi:acyl-CoA synthetase (NDP forming)